MNQKLVRLQFLITIVLYPFSSFKLLRCYEYSLNYFSRFFERISVEIAKKGRFGKKSLESFTNKRLHFLTACVIMELLK